MVRFRSFEEEYDSKVVMQAFEKIMNALEKGDFAMANSLVKFLDSSLVYLTGDENENKVKNKVLERIYEYRKKDDNVKHLKLSSDVRQMMMKGFGLNDVDKAFVLWHELYSKWLRDLVIMLGRYGKLGKKSKSMYIED